MDVTVTITEYKRTLKALGYAENTIELYRWGLEQFSAYLAAAGVNDLRQVTANLVTDYQARIRQRPVAEETKAVLIRPVKRMFEHLSERHLLLLNPCEGIVEVCRQNRPIGTTLSFDEVEKFLKQPNLSLRTGIRDRALIEVFYATGIRCDELIRLSVYDADLKDKVLYVRKAKGGRQRVVPLGKTAGGFLKEYLTKIRPRYVRKNVSQRALFVTITGRRFSAHSIRTLLLRYRQSAAIKKPVTPHTLRRTCATHLLLSGADIVFVQKLLGHQCLKTTQQYTKIMPADVKKMHSKTHPNTKETTDK